MLWERGVVISIVAGRCCLKGVDVPTLKLMMVTRFQEIPEMVDFSYKM